MPDHIDLADVLTPVELAIRVTEGQPIRIQVSGGVLRKRSIETTVADAQHMRRIFGALGFAAIDVMDLPEPPAEAEPDEGPDLTAFEAWLRDLIQ